MKLYLKENDGKQKFRQKRLNIDSEVIGYYSIVY